MVISMQYCAITREPSLSILELKKNYSVEVGESPDRKLSIEFCPDNTCDLFVADKGTSLGELDDFVYLYTLFFSDFYTLNEWKKFDSSLSVAKKILSKKKYQLFLDNSKSDLEIAKNVLCYLYKERKIKLYYIRYDEGVRNVSQTNLTSVLAVEP